MKAKLIIISPEVKKRAIAIIEALPLDVVHEVAIREHKKDRSAEQNRTLWLWYTVIGEAMGESKESVHELLKGKFLCNIYERDSPDYAEMLATLRTVYREGMRDESLMLHKKVIALTSTTTATVSQMQEYLTSIEHWATEFAIRLPFPEE
jgi:hypothetical protein